MFSGATGNQPSQYAHAVKPLMCSATRGHRLLKPDTRRTASRPCVGHHRRELRQQQAEQVARDRDDDDQRDRRGPSVVTITGAMPVTRIVPARPMTKAPHQFVSGETAARVVELVDVVRRMLIGHRALLDPRGLPDCACDRLTQGLGESVKAPHALIVPSGRSMAESSTCTPETWPVRTLPWVRRRDIRGDRDCREEEGEELGWRPLTGSCRLGLNGHAPFKAPETREDLHAYVRGGERDRVPVRPVRGRARQAQRQAGPR